MCSTARVLAQFPLLFAHRRHAECVTYGPGNSATSHMANEVVEIADHLNSIEVLKEAFHQLATLSGR
jgi:acetylornithine deacetylase/succinyl-diaminopimelate desuccinylase-like protein